MLASVLPPLSVWPALVVDHVRENATKAAVLAAFVASIAYIHSPRAKTLVFSMPIPFTCAYLASRLPIQGTHLTGLVLVTLYHWIVYAVCRVWRGPLAAGIAAGVVFYLASAVLLAAALRQHPLPFVGLAAVVFGLWLMGVLAYRPIHEPGHRSTAPWWIKGPLIFAGSLGILALTRPLAGAVTTFPYAGVFTSYEMRHSLRTLAGQYTINNLSFFLMFLAVWGLEQLHAPAPWPLAGGWVVLALSLGAIYRWGVGRPKEPIPVGE